MLNTSVQNRKSVKQTCMALLISRGKKKYSKIM